TRLEHAVLVNGFDCNGHESDLRKHRLDDDAMVPDTVTEARPMNVRHSLDFVDRAPRIAGDDTVCLAVHQQVEGFEHDRADEGVCAFGFNDGTEGVLAPQELQGHAFRFAPPGTSAVGVANPDRGTRTEAQSLDQGLRQHKHCGPSIHDARDRFPTNLIWL